MRGVGSPTQNRSITSSRPARRALSKEFYVLRETESPSKLRVRTNTEKQRNAKKTRRNLGGVEGGHFLCTPAGQRSRPTAALPSSKARRPEMRCCTDPVDAADEPKTAPAGAQRASLGQAHTPLMSTDFSRSGMSGPFSFSSGLPDCCAASPDLYKTIAEIPDVARLVEMTFPPGAANGPRFLTPSPHPGREPLQRGLR